MKPSSQIKKFQPIKAMSQLFHRTKTPRIGIKAVSPAIWSGKTYKREIEFVDGSKITLRGKVESSMNYINLFLRLENSAHIGSMFATNSKTYLTSAGIPKDSILITGRDIEKSFQRRGLGKLLLREAEDAGRRVGAKRICICPINNSLKRAAKRQGFVELTDSAGKTIISQDRLKVLQRDIVN